MSTPRPTKADIYSLYYMAVGHYSQLHEDMRQSIQMERMEFRPLLTGLLAGDPIRIPPTGAVAVRTLVDHVILGEDPEIILSQPPGHGALTKRQKEDMEYIQGWLVGGFHKFHSASIESPLRDAVSQAANPGEGILSYAPMFDDWPTTPIQDQGETMPEFKARQRDYARARAQAWPFDVRSVPPTTCYADPAHDPPRWYIEVRKRQRREYGELPETAKPSGDGKFKGQQVEVEELLYCSQEWYAHYVNAVPLLTAEHGADDEGVAPNPVGRIWYQRAINGMGKNDYDNRPEYKIRGLLRDAWDLLIMEAESLNQVNAIRRHQAYGSPTATHVDGVNAAKKALTDNPIRVGDITFYDPAVKLGVLELPKVDPAVFQTLDLIQGLLEVALIASVLKGIGQAGDAAAKYRTMVAEARLKVQPVRESCQQMVAGMMMDWLDIIRENEDLFQAGVSINGTLKGTAQLLTLKPSMIMAGLIVTVNFNPTTAEEKAFLLEEGLKRLTAGPNGTATISMEEFLGKYAGVKDPQRALDDMAKDVVWQALLEDAKKVAVALGRMKFQAMHPEIYAMVLQQENPQPGLSGALSSSGTEGAGTPAPAPVPLSPGQGIQPGPQGGTPPGEAPVAPPLGGPQDMLNGARALTAMPR